MPAFSSSSAPTLSPGPVTRLHTPAGTPASRSTWQKMKPISGASDDGLMTTVLPAISAPAARPREPVLAHLEHHQRAVVELALADQVGGAAHQFQALPPAEGTPGGKR